MRRYLAIIGLICIVLCVFLSACGEDVSTMDSPLSELQNLSASSESMTPVKGKLSPTINSTPPEVADPAPAPGPYDGHKLWCDSAIPVPCKTAKDCSKVEHPSGKTLKCVRPFYADPGSDYRVCSPGWSTRDERDEQRSRIRKIVEARGRSPRTKENMIRFLSMVGMRETTLRRWKRHRLNDDIRSNKHSWLRHATRYGHQYRVQKIRGVDKVVGVTMAKDGNPYYGDPDRWRTGVGLYGMNAAGFAFEWHQNAPPEVLCDDIIATEVYMRVARRALRKLRGGIDCDGDGSREWRGSGDGAPTLRDIHRAVSGGKLCPGKREIGNVSARAVKSKVNLDMVVGPRDLLTPFEPESQVSEWRELKSKLNSMSTAD